MAPPRWKIWVTSSVLALLLSATLPAQRQGPDLSSATIEELMNVRVTSVSKHPQSLRESAAAVSVVTAEDIARSGANSIPELLRRVVGMNVARINATTWAISARGFNSQWANKMLVLIDGRTIYDPFFAGVFWDIQDTMLEDIDRIEIIRGPGGSVWGANAVNGVINIITKPAGETQGGLATVGGGNHERGFGSVRYGGKLGDRTNFRVFSKYKNDNSTRPVSPDEYGLNLARAGFRTDTEISRSDVLTLSGETYGGMDTSVWQQPLLQQPYAADYQDHAALAGGFVTAEWNHVYRNGSDSILRSYYEYHGRSADNLDHHRHAFEVDVQHNFRVGIRQRISWGGAVRYLGDSTSSQGRGIRFSPPSSSDGIASLFVEDAVSVLGERLLFTFGSKLQYDGYSGTEILPTVRGIWKPDHRHAVWAAVSRAARTPTRLDRDLITDVFSYPTPTLPLVAQIRGSRHVSAEHVLAYETGYRWQPAQSFTVDAAAFYNRYADLIGYQDGATEFSPQPSPHFVLPWNFTNAFDGPSYGGEVQTKYQVSERWRLGAGYAFLRQSTHLKPGMTLVRPEIPDTSPRHTLLIESSYRVFKNAEASAFLRTMSSAVAANAPSYAQLDVTMRAKISETAVLSLNAEDLFSRREPEFGLTSGNEPAARGRSIYVKLTWQF